MAISITGSGFSAASSGSHATVSDYETASISSSPSKISELSLATTGPSSTSINYDFTIGKTTNANAKYGRVRVSINGTCYAYSTKDLSNNQSYSISISGLSSSTTYTFSITWYLTTESTNKNYNYKDASNAGETVGAKAYKYAIDFTTSASTTPIVPDTPTAYMVNVTASTTTTKTATTYSNENTTISAPSFTPSGMGTDAKAAWIKLTIPSTGTYELNYVDSSSVDSYMYLYDSSGSTVTKDDDSGGSFQPKITKTLTAGTYYVACLPYSAGNTTRGTFSISYQVVYLGYSITQDKSGNVTSSPNFTISGGRPNASTSNNTVHFYYVRKRVRANGEISDDSVSDAVFIGDGTLSNHVLTSNITFKENSSLVPGTTYTYDVYYWHGGNYDASTIPKLSSNELFATTQSYTYWPSSEGCTVTVMPSETTSGKISVDVTPTEPRKYYDREYKIYYKLSSATTYTDSKTVYTVYNSEYTGVGDGSTRITGLTAGQTYDIKVEYTNPGGGTGSAVTRVTLPTIKNTIEYGNSVKYDGSTSNLTSEIYPTFTINSREVDRKIYITTKSVYSAETTLTATYGTAPKNTTSAEIKFIWDTDKIPSSWVHGGEYTVYAHLEPNGSSPASTSFKVKYYEWGYGNITFDKATKQVSVPLHLVPNTYSNGERTHRYIFLDTSGSSKVSSTYQNKYFIKNKTKTDALEVDSYIESYYDTLHDSMLISDYEKTLTFKGSYGCEYEISNFVYYNCKYSNGQVTSESTTYNVNISKTFKTDYHDGCEIAISNIQVEEKTGMMDLSLPKNYLVKLRINIKDLHYYYIYGNWSYTNYNGDKITQWIDDNVIGNSSIQINTGSKEESMMQDNSANSIYHNWYFLDLEFIVQVPQDRTGFSYDVTFNFFADDPQREKNLIKSIKTTIEIINWDKAIEITTETTDIANLKINFKINDTSLLKDDKYYKCSCSIQSCFSKNGEGDEPSIIYLSNSKTTNNITKTNTIGSLIFSDLVIGTNYMFMENPQILEYDSETNQKTASYKLGIVQLETKPKIFEWSKTITEKQPSTNLTANDWNLLAKLLNIKTKGLYRQGGTGTSGFIERVDYDYTTVKSKDKFLADYYNQLRRMCEDIKNCTLYKVNYNKTLYSEQKSKDVITADKINQLKNILNTDISPKE